MTSTQSHNAYSRLKMIEKIYRCEILYLTTIIIKQWYKSINKKQSQLTLITFMNLAEDINTILIKINLRAFGAELRELRKK